MSRKNPIMARIEREIAQLDVAIHDGLENVKCMERERERLKHLLHEGTPKFPRSRKVPDKVETLGNELDPGPMGGN